MKTTNWASIDAEGKTGRPTGPIAKILDGREYAFHPGSSITAPEALGKLQRDGDGLMCVPHSGAPPFPLTAAECQRFVFDLPSGQHVGSATGAPSHADKLAIIAKAPAWAQRTIAEHFLPAEVAAHDKAQKDARTAQLQAIGKAARGGIPPQNSGSTGQSDRAAQLREIGRLASAR